MFLLILMCIQSTIFEKVYRIKFKSEYLETENKQQHEVWGLKFLFIINIILRAVTLHSAIFSRPFPNQMHCPVFLMKMLPAAVSAQQHLDYWPQSRLPPRGPHSSGVPGSTRLSLCTHVAQEKKQKKPSLSGISTNKERPAGGSRLCFLSPEGLVLQKGSLSNYGRNCLFF